jgi:hypothetical protein
MTAVSSLSRHKHMHKQRMSNGSKSLEQMVLVMKAVFKMNLVISFFDQYAVISRWLKLKILDYI